MLPTLATALFGYVLRAPLPLAVAPRASTVCSEANAVGRREATQLAAAALTTSVILTPTAANAAYPGLSIMTTEGEMQFEMWDDVAPKHVDSFLKLAKQGFFDGGAFHRIIPGFVIQGGDPNVKVGYGPDGTLDGGDKANIRKWGTGGPGYNVPAECAEGGNRWPSPRRKTTCTLHTRVLTERARTLCRQVQQPQARIVRCSCGTTRLVVSASVTISVSRLCARSGVLSMARAADPDSAGSQFFVCLGRLESLDNKYTVFGKLTKGDDVLKRIAAAQTVKGDIPFKRQGIQRVDAL
jgi:cyclophilin family peptidyl-prolyl cis-trans isomerase